MMELEVAQLGESSAESSGELSKAVKAVPATMEVRFTTKLPSTDALDYAALIPRTQVFSVPTDLKRLGLSEMINQLLQHENVIPYDFEINGKLLRTSLGQFILDSSMSFESITEIEYFHAAVPLDTNPNISVPDWIAALEYKPNVGVLSGCLDGVARVWDEQKNDFTAQVKVSEAAVKDVAFFNSNSEEKVYFATATKDGYVRVYSRQDDSVALVAASQEHKDSVESLAVFPEVSSMANLKLCSGSWDSSILLWKCELEGHVSQSSKRSSSQKSTEDIRATLEPAVKLSSHVGVVSALCWPHPLALYSASWDKTVVHWDAQRGEKVHTWAFESGFADCSIAMIDPRTSESQVPKKLSRAHKGWVTGVTWIESRLHCFASCSRDGTVKLWDTRSDIPLVTHKLGGVAALTICSTESELFIGTCDTNIYRLKL